MNRHNYRVSRNNIRPIQLPGKHLCWARTNGRAEFAFACVHAGTSQPHTNPMPSQTTVNLSGTNLKPNQIDRKPSLYNSASRQPETSTSSILVTYQSPWIRHTRVTSDIASRHQSATDPEPTQDQPQTLNQSNAKQRNGACMQNKMKPGLCGYFRALSRVPPPKPAAYQSYSQ